MKISDIMVHVNPLSLNHINSAIITQIPQDAALIPVIDEQGQYLGTITRRVLQALEKQKDQVVNLSSFVDPNTVSVLADARIDSVLPMIYKAVVLNQLGQIVGSVDEVQAIAYLHNRLHELKDQMFAISNSGKVYTSQDIISMETVFKELTSIKELIRELEATINSSYDGIFITDSSGIVLRINHAYERITGIKASEIVGKSMQKLVEEKYYDESVTLLVMEKKESITISQRVRGNQKILVTGNPIFDEHGQLFRVVTNVRDVTQLTGLQNQLQKTKEQTLKYKTELELLRSIQIHSSEIVFRSQAMVRTMELAQKIADVNSTVLITGESGTGKELVAKFIHKQGKGPTKPFITINCAAIPETLLESELFGYEGGAFTGAKREGKPGLFELAHEGTLFLDEVGELPAVLQVKLLRVLQEREVVRVGGTKAKAVHVRIIAATHRDIIMMTKTGLFREDLYYRLMVVPLHIPPLRERREDIPLLILRFIEKFNRSFGFIKHVSPQAIDRLVEYSWPGNVRELENVIERMMVIATEDELGVELLPESIYSKAFFPRRGTKLKAAVEETEAYLLSKTYQEYGCWKKVAEILGVNRTTVFRKAFKYGLTRS